MTFTFVENDNSAKIKVIGVGCAGNNAINNMIDAQRDDHLISAAIVGFINDFVRFRPQKLLVREIWQLYPFNFGRAMEVQQILIKFCWHLGAAWLEPPRACAP